MVQLTAEATIPIRSWAWAPHLPPSSIEIYWVYPFLNILYQHEMLGEVGWADLRHTGWLCQLAHMTATPRKGIGVLQAVGFPSPAQLIKAQDEVSLKLCPTNLQPARNPWRCSAKRGPDGTGRHETPTSRSLATTAMSLPGLPKLRGCQVKSEPTWKKKSKLSLPSPPRRLCFVGLFLNRSRYLASPFTVSSQLRSCI